jgi:hypothetical protein
LSTLVTNATTQHRRYSLSMESAMNDNELRELKEKRNVLFQNLREARSSYRSAITKVK